MSRLLIKNAKALLGTHPAGALRVHGGDMATLPRIEDGWLLAENGRITALGSMDTWPGITDWNGLEVIDATGRFVLPGWCDPHTHAVFAATREEEWVDRLRGLTYQEIAAKGGGILNSARKLREASEDDLFVAAKARVEELMRLGTVAIEIKSGYGLSLEAELKMLRVVKRLKEALPLQVKATLLGAHALPTEFKEHRSAYLDMVVNELIPAAAREGLADFVDVFCETNYFTVPEMVRVLEAGAKHGLRGKVHVNQFTSIGAIEAAVEHDCLSVDHLEVMNDGDIKSLSPLSTGEGPGVRSNSPLPTLLPGCSFFLGIHYAPARRLMQQGCAVALASDFNPGSTPNGNMNLVLSLACTQLKMLPEEAINAATLNAAAAMDLSHEVGSLSIGKRASFIVTTPLHSPAALPYYFGSDNIDTVVIDGRIIRAGEAVA
ncbi:MAG: imidazolonepropionase [Flavobacteriales bacterium]|nr:MAG: imidazolonepropionase [Flavobacteriales bacterium]